MRQYLYNNRGIISWIVLFMTVDILWTHWFTNGKTSIKILTSATTYTYYEFYTLAPVYVILVLFCIYNVLFQWNGVKEKVFDDDNILDS